MKKCNRDDCTACPYIQEGRDLSINGSLWSLNKKYDCNSYNIVYGIICKKEKYDQVYIGETKRLLK